MPGVAIGDRKEFDGVSEGREFRGGPAELDLAVVWMSADGENPQHFAMVRRTGGKVQF